MDCSSRCSGGPICLVVLFASDPTSGWAWLGFAALVLVLAGLIGYLVRQARRRGRARREEAEAIVAILPQEYRFRPEPLWWRVVGIVLIASASVAAGLLFGQARVLLALLVVGGPFYVIAMRHRSEHRREIIASVRASAAGMDRDELRQLVEALEFHHGEAEMRTLRRLLNRPPGQPVV
jgi:hypothetical protein